jgi:ceramide glucosyltransferase
LIESAIIDGILGVGLFGLFTSTIYSGLVLAGVRRFLQPAGCGCTASRGLGDACGIQAPVSILKPVHGAEPGLDVHLEGFFQQDYSNYEILFCARTAEDAGLQIARRVAAQYPAVPVRFLTSGEPVYANAKVASLAVMAKAAAHDLFVISDSDVCVQPNYLREVVAPFADPMMGAVTCLYRGTVPASTKQEMWAQLEGVGMSIEMTAGVLVANLVEGMQFLLGPTMAMRREAVETIGGFAPLGQYCADDFLLGNKIAAAGYDVVLSTHVIDHVILNAGFAASMRHQARWMKSTRFSRPKGHLGTALTFSTPFALVASLAFLMTGHAWLAAAALAWGVVTRMMLAAVLGRLVLYEPNLLRTILLYPLRDLMGFGFWLASYTSNRILWRGETFELLADGLMRPLHPGTVAADAGTKEHEPALSA